MEVLQHKGKGVLAEIAGSRLPDGARRRIGPEGLVVGPAVVVTRQPEEPRNRQDQQRRRKRQPCGPTGRRRTEPAVRRGPEDFGRVKRREVRAVRVMSVLERRPRRVDEERRQSQHDDRRLDPPRVAPRRLSKPTNRQPDRCSRCRHDTDPRGHRLNRSPMTHAADPGSRRRVPAITITVAVPLFKVAEHARLLRARDSSRWSGRIRAYAI